MRGYSVYLLGRLGQFVLVVFIGINIAFIVTHATPIDPVEQSIAAATQFGSTNPEAIAMMRQSLKELYGLQGSLWDQYLVFWKRMAVGDFGPSLSAFPTPVRVLIARALPWTVERREQFGTRVHDASTDVPVVAQVPVRALENLRILLC